jgi:hypothetical protein
VQRPGDAGPVVVAELAYVVDYVSQILIGYFEIVEESPALIRQGLGWAPEVQDDLHQRRAVRDAADGLHQSGRQDVEQQADLASVFVLCHVLHFSANS